MFHDVEQSRKSDRSAYSSVVFSFFVYLLSDSTDEIGISSSATDASYIFVSDHVCLEDGSIIII